MIHVGYLDPRTQNSGHWVLGILSDGSALFPGRWHGLIGNSANKCSISPGT